MASDKNNRRQVVCRCPSCGHVALRESVSAPGDTCPKCNEGQLEERPLVGGAIHYSVADRTRGPSIEDGRLGCMAYFQGWMSREQLAACLRIQRDAIERGEEAPKFGEVAASAGLLNESQVEALLHMQAIHRPSTYERKFGAIALRMGLLTQPQLDAALEKQTELLGENREAPALGIILVEEKVLTTDQVREIMTRQRRQVDRAPAAEQPEPETPPAKSTLPPPPRAGEHRVVCRCQACGKAHIRADCSEDALCPDCGSGRYGPVPHGDNSARYQAADRSGGPAIEDSRLGHMAFYAGLMTKGQIRECIEEQRRASKAGEPVPRFGEVAVRRGLLKEKQIERLLRMQAIYRPTEYDSTFGAIAVRTGYITQEQLDECLAEQERLLETEREAPMLGILLSEKGCLTDAQVRAILSFQAKHGQGVLLEMRDKPAARAGMDAHTRRQVLIAGAAGLLIVLAVWAANTGWFGLFAHAEPAVVIGCTACGEASRTDIDATACPVCDSQSTVAPLVTCSACGRVYLHGTQGAVHKCPECGSRKYTPVRSLQGLGTEWVPPAETPAPQPLAGTDRSR